MTFHLFSFFLLGDVNGEGEQANRHLLAQCNCLYLFSQFLRKQEPLTLDEYIKYLKKNLKSHLLKYSLYTGKFTLLSCII